MSEKNEAATATAATATTKGTANLLNSMENTKNPGVNVDPSVFNDSDGFSTKILIVKTANKWAEEAAETPDPIQLWGDFWFEGECCCLFADTNVGKSIYAVQMAAEIAKQRPVIYFDFELSAKQFQLRCTGEDGSLFHFPDWFYRVEIDPCQMNVEEFEKEILNEMEAAAKNVGADVLIVDNLTWIASAAEKPDAAGVLMRNLVTLKKKNGWSILVISHTPKRIMTEPITQNNLSGCKKLANFFDSMFAIAYSAKDENLRYIKQIKVRYGKGEHRGNNVLVCEIIKSGGLLRLHVLECSTEAEHLKAVSPKEKEIIKNKMLELREKGLSFREIAKELRQSYSSVQRFLNRK